MGWLTARWWRWAKRGLTTTGDNWRCCCSCLLAALPCPPSCCPSGCLHVSPPDMLPACMPLVSVPATAAGLPRSSQLQCPCSSRPSCGVHTRTHARASALARACMLAAPHRKLPLLFLWRRLHFCDAEAQKTYFARQFELARSSGLPMFLHLRAAAADFLDIVQRHAGRSQH